jgi:hypothetical protein
MNRRVVPLLMAALLLTLGLASPAAASADFNQKIAVLSSWTQADSTSQSAWNNALNHQADWTEYSFDWSTDFCSVSPDQPLGYDFRTPCRRHDFGYRNYKLVNQFPANKAHVDSAFYYDLKAVCSTYNVVKRPACYSLAWTYYEAVRNFGSIIVDQAGLDRAAQVLAQSEADAAQNTAASAPQAS